MKKVIMLLMISMFLLTGCKENSTKLEKLDRGEVVSLTEQSVNLINEQKYDEFISGMFDEELKKEIDVEKIKNGIEEKTKDVGKFKRLGEFEALEKTEDGSYICLAGQKVIHEKGSVNYTIGFNENYKIIAFYVDSK